MKTLHCIIIVFVWSINCLNAQYKQIDDYFMINPSNIETQNAEIQEYNVTLKWQNLDAISGSKINCIGVKATYLVGLNNDYVGWKNVSLAQIEDIRQKEFKGTVLPSFNNFTYKAMDTAFLSEGFYTHIPAEQRDLAKWLVSDAAQMQGLAWYVFDSLAYNQEFVPKLLEDYDIKFENWVTFSSQYQKLIWSGLSKHNNEICAIIEFESLYNPLEIDNKQMLLKGRSLYYGEMWISLTDKQVEYARMVEDVIMRLTSSMFPDGQIINLQRDIEFDKIN